MERISDERLADDVLKVMEQDARTLWNERQETCAWTGANIPMPLIEVRANVLATMIAELRAYRTPTGLDRAWVVQYCDRYYTRTCSLHDSWVTDTADALRLATQEDAEAIAAHLRFTWPKVKAIALAVVASPSKTPLTDELRIGVTAAIERYAVEHGKTPDEMTALASSMLIERASPEGNSAVADASRAKEEGGCEPEGYVDIVFDGPPSHESGRFVEVENAQGRSINFGKWVHREDGYWALRIAPTSPHPVSVGEGWKEPMNRLVAAARLLQANSEGCAVNHHREDFALHGKPGWLVDTEADIANALAALSAPPASPPAGVGEKARTAIDGVLREFGVYWRERDEARRAEFIAAIAGALSPVQAEE